MFPDDMFPVATGLNYTRAELSARTPWKKFFTNRTGQALLLCAFAYVSFSPSQKRTFLFLLPSFVKLILFLIAAHTLFAIFTLSFVILRFPIIFEHI